MNSATDVWEGGLGSSSGELGHNLMDHMLNSGAGGRVEGFEDKYIFGLLLFFGSRFGLPTIKLDKFIHQLLIFRMFVSSTGFTI